MYTGVTFRGYGGYAYLPLFGIWSEGTASSPGPSPGGEGAWRGNPIPAHHLDSSGPQSQNETKIDIPYFWEQSYAPVYIHNLHLINAFSKQ